MRRSVRRIPPTRWPRSTLMEVTSEESARDTSLLDEWRAELGDEVIAALVRVAAEGIAAGTLPGFSEKHEFLEYLREPHRRFA